VAHDARHLDLMHRVDQARRGAGGPEDVADVDDFGEGGAVTVECRGNHDAEQALLADLGE
jgi:hypothetical protein